LSAVREVLEPATGGKICGKNMRLREVALFGTIRGQFFEKEKKS
jgi:hypothetical protein